MDGAPQSVKIGCEILEIGGWSKANDVQFDYRTARCGGMEDKLESLQADAGAGDSPTDSRAEVCGAMR